MAGRKTQLPIAAGMVSALLLVYLASFPYWICQGSSLVDRGKNLPLVNAMNGFYAPAEWLFAYLPPYERYVRGVTERQGIFLSHER